MISLAQLRFGVCGPHVAHLRDQLVNGQSGGFCFSLCDVEVKVWCCPCVLKGGDLSPAVSFSFVEDGPPAEVAGICGKLPL